jgi:hypothetical protein
MATFSFDVPDELLPALQAEFLIVSTAGATGAATAEEYFAASVIETLRQRCETYKVGPYAPWNQSSWLTVRLTRRIKVLMPLCCRSLRLRSLPRQKISRLSRR